MGVRTSGGPRCKTHHVVEGLGGTSRLPFKVGLWTHTDLSGGAFWPESRRGSSRGDEDMPRRSPEVARDASNLDPRSSLIRSSNLDPGTSILIESSILLDPPSWILLDPRSSSILDPLRGAQKKPALEPRPSLLEPREPHDDVNITTRRSARIPWIGAGPPSLGRGARQGRHQMRRQGSPAPILEIRADLQRFMVMSFCFLLSIPSHPLAMVARTWPGSPNVSSKVLFGKLPEQIPVSHPAATRAGRVKIGSKK